GFKYYWRKDVKNLRVAEEAFDRVDEIRKRDLNLGPYGTNEAFFKK
ncbi:MAG: cupin domain-containing protein, partial [Shewanella sp.]